jgi:hypothetical protein
MLLIHFWIVDAPILECSYVLNHMSGIMYMNKFIRKSAIIFLTSSCGIIELTHQDLNRQVGLTPSFGKSHNWLCNML